MYNVKFKVKDGRHSLPRPSSRVSQRSSSPSNIRTQRSRSADRTKITKITKNGTTITTVVDGKLTYGNCTPFGKYYTVNVVFHAAHTYALFPNSLIKVSFRLTQILFNDVN